MFFRSCAGPIALMGLLIVGCQPTTTVIPAKNTVPAAGTEAAENNVPPNETEKPMKVAQRYGMIVGLKKDQIDRYRQLHAEPWDGVLDQLDRSNVRNYSIWLVELRPDEHYLFGYLEYTGDDFDADMKAMGDDDTTRKWWKETDPCQTPIPTAGEGQQWVMAEEVFYHDRDRRGAPRMPPPPIFEAGKAE